MTPHTNGGFSLEVVASSVKEVLPLYMSPGRFYHDWTHIQNCLFQSDKFFSSYVGEEKFAPPKWNGNPETLLSKQDAKVCIDLAILWHDVIYFPWSKDNENMSAKLWHRWSGSGRVNDEPREIVTDLICSTAWHLNEVSSVVKDGMKKNQDMALLLRDIDFSIFGAREQEYKKYSNEVYLEYKPWLPSSQAFLHGRLDFILGLKKQKKLFFTEYFVDDREHWARENIKREIKQLEEDLLPYSKR